MIGQMMRTLLLGLLFTGLVSCVVARVYKTPEIQKTFSESLSQADSHIAKIESDLSEKQSVYNQLVAEKSSKSVEAMPQLTQLIERMKSVQSEIQQTQARMVELNSQFAALAHSESKIMSNSEKWPQADATVTEFEKLSQKLNALFAQYSEASNQVAGLMERKKLFQQAKVVDVDRRFVTAINAGARHLEEMNKDLQMHQALLERLLKTSPAAEANPYRSLREMLESMNTDAQKVRMSLRELRDLRAEFIDRFQTKEKISSSDPQWNEFTKIKSSYEDLVGQVRHVRSRFTTTSNRFLTAAKTLPGAQ